MPKYKLAIFDLDGTLSDSLPWFRRVVNSIADKHRFKRIEDHDVEMLRGKSSREIIRYLQVPIRRIPAIARDMRRLKSESIHAIPLFAGVDVMLGELSQLGVTLAVVSSDSAGNVRKALCQNRGTATGLAGFAVRQRSCYFQAYLAGWRRAARPGGSVQCLLESPFAGFHELCITAVLASHLQELCAYL